MEAAEGSLTSEPPAPEAGARSGGKRAREGPMLFGTQLIQHEATEDELVEAAPKATEASDSSETPQGAEASSVPSETPAKLPAAVQVDNRRLRCSLCSSLLKPPIYQCVVGHIACCRCRVKLPDGGCRTCRTRNGDGDGDGAVPAYKHCPGLDLFFGDLRVPCHFAEYGCESFVPYFRSDEHRAACGHAPCHCPEPGCCLVCSQRALAAHLAGEHSWPADEIAYGTPRMLAFPVPTQAAAAAAATATSSPAPAPARHLRLLRGDDASVFVVAAGPLGAGAAVSVVLVRANSPVRPRFECTFCAKPPPEAAGLDGACFFATMPVRSSALADGAGVAPEKELFFAVPGEMLCEGTRELVVSVRIDGLQRLDVLPAQGAVDLAGNR